MLLEALTPVENKEPRQIAGQVCWNLIESAKKAKKRFNTTATEIMRYCYADDFAFEYQTLPEDAWFKAKVSKTAEALQIFGPALYAKNPNRKATPRTWASERAQERSSVMERYLNYTPDECDYRMHARRVTDESIAAGAGVMWTGFDGRKKLVTSKYVCIDDILLDPDAIMQEDMRYVIRERVRPKWEVISEMKQWKSAINQLKPCKQRKSNSGKKNYYQQTDQTAECVRYYEIYMRVGLHHYKHGTDLMKKVNAAEPEMAAESEVDDSPLKYIVGDNGVFIGVTNWEVPFYLDNEFPCTIQSYFHESNSIWPVSPLKNGLGFQRAMNWIVTLLMGKFRFTSRSILAVLSQNGNDIDEDQLYKVLNGNAVEAIKIMANGDGVSIKDFLQQFDWNHDYLGAGTALLDRMELQFEKATGLYAVLYTGESSRQSRSAKDAQIKDEKSQSRLMDMRDCVDEFHSKVARKEALAARFLHKRQDISAIFGKQYGEQWGLLIKPDEQVAQQMMQSAMQGGLDQQEAQMMVSELLQNATSLEKWLYECDYSIEAGSTQRKDINQHIDTLKEMMNQTVPTLLGSGDPLQMGAAFLTQVEYYKAIGADEKIIAEFEHIANVFKEQAALPAPPMPPMEAQPQ